MIYAYGVFIQLSRWVTHCYNNLHFSNGVVVSRVMVSLMWQCYTLQSRCSAEVTLSY
jgi:hypothetical protein